ncbi:MAG: hypothetical protein IJR07_08460 [Bacteroidaceae bacterium]|nr:hypothetical protein [Bacteroidaceae bacterium]
MRTNNYLWLTALLTASCGSVDEAVVPPVEDAISFKGNTVINATTTNTFYAEYETWFMNSGNAGFTLTYDDSVTFTGDWAGTDGYTIDRY